MDLENCYAPLKESLHASNSNFCRLNILVILTVTVVWQQVHTFDGLFDYLTLRIRPHRCAPPCAASQWEPGQGRPAAHLPPHTPFRHSLLRWFYARHLRGIYIRHQPASSQCTSCSSSKAVMVVEEEEEEGGLWRRVELLERGNLLSGGADGVGGWLGRVRRAHGRPYPLSCFMTTVLNGAWTSITASCHSEPSDSGRCQPKKSSQESARAVLSQESLLLLIRDHLSSAAQDTVPQSDELSEFNILDPKRSWVVVFPWFLWGENRAGVNFICIN